MRVVDYPFCKYKQSIPVVDMFIYIVGKEAAYGIIEHCDFIAGCNWFKIVTFIKLMGKKHCWRVSFKNL